MDEVKRVALRLPEAIGKGDIDGMRAALHEDATWWVPGTLPVSGTWRGHDQIFDQMFAAAGAAIEPGTLHVEVVNVIADDTTVVMEWHVQARSTAGRAYDNRYSVITEVKGDKIAAVREYTDMLTARNALFTDHPIDAPQPEGRRGSR